MARGVITRIIVLTRLFISDDTNKCMMKPQARFRKDTLQFFIVVDPCVDNEKRIHKQLNLIRLSLDTIKGLINAAVYITGRLIKLVIQSLSISPVI